MIELNSKYKPLFKNVTRYNVITGGRASGKSYSIATYLLLLTFERTRTILFARYTMTSVAISIFPEFIDKIETFGLEELFEITKNEIINKQTGSKIIFKGIKAGSSQQSANLKSVAGIDTLVIDESEEIIDEDVFDKIDFSVRSNKHFNKVILLLNPTTKEHWIYTRFFQQNGVNAGENVTKDDVTLIHTSYLDIIERLPNSLIKSFSKMKESNPVKYNHIVMGGWLDKAEGVIFNNWEIGEFSNELDFGFGMDFGFSSDPTTLTKVAIDNKNKIIYLEELLYKEGLTTTEIYNIISSQVSRNEIIADNAEPRLIEELKRKGLNIKPCVKGAGSIAEGITLIQDYKLVVSPNSTNIVKELNNYIWSDKKSGQAVDMYNHSLDGIRYYVSHRIKKPSIQKYKIR